MIFHHLTACFQWGQNTHHTMDQIDVYFITIMGDFYIVSIFKHDHCTQVLQHVLIRSPPER